MEYKEIFIKAYKYMDVDLIDGDCGKLCGYHCCRRKNENGEVFGIYFLPYEYETMQEGEGLIDENCLEVHTKIAYDLPLGIKKLYYGYCKDNTNCIRDIRPIQCRTFPFAAHFEDGELVLVIEKNQEHDCPLINKREDWNPDFEKSILAGWNELIKIDKVKKLIEFESKERIKTNNILYVYRGGLDNET